MWLLDKMLKKLIRAGKLVITDYDGKVYEYGPGGDVNGEYGEPIRVRLTNKKASSHIARYPQVGAGEAYMWGWLVVEEPHDIRDMVLYVTARRKCMATRRCNRRVRSSASRRRPPRRSTAST